MDIGFFRALEIAEQYNSIAFSGGRKLLTPTKEVAESFAYAVEPIKALVGCASGADLVFRKAFPNAEVFNANRAEGKKAFALRSIEVIDAAITEQALIVSFPGRACPDGLAPSPNSSKCFCGKGSGSWATLAYAIGKGMDCLVYLDELMPVPDWGFIQLGNGWYNYQSKLE